MFFCCWKHSFCLGISHSKASFLFYSVDQFNWLVNILRNHRQFVQQDALFWRNRAMGCPAVEDNNNNISIQPKQRIIIIEVTLVLEMPFSTLHTGMFHTMFQCCHDIKSCVKLLWLIFILTGKCLSQFNLIRKLYNRIFIQTGFSLNSSAVSRNQ